jgi:AcrR family transcriptional regulator
LSTPLAAGDSTASASVTVSTPSASPPKATLRNDLKLFTREKLLDAALQAFSERGFRGTTIDYIVELAGTTVPTFYRHFAGKKDLMDPLQAYLVKEVILVTSRIDANPAPTRDDVRQWVDEYVVMWRRLRLLCAAYWEATSTDADFAAKTVPETLRMVEQHPKFLNSIAPERREKLRVRLAVVLMLLDRIVILSGAERDEGLATALLDEFADMVWISVFSPARELA